MGLLGKLGRVFINTSEYYFNFNYEKNRIVRLKKRIDVPYFLLGFVMMALFHTYVSLPHGYANYR